MLFPNDAASAEDDAAAVAAVIMVVVVVAAVEEGCASRWFVVHFYSWHSHAVERWG